MRVYPKIETLYDRDEDFKVIVGKHRRPEYGFINRWVATEKIDGTNVRLHFQRDGDLMGSWVRGKSDNAQMPQPLLDTLTMWCADNIGAVSAYMAKHDLTTLTLFGEGYGAKIQSGGYYRKDQDFILFDVLVQDSIWLSNEQMMQTAAHLELRHVPFLGYLTEDVILDMVIGYALSLVADEVRAAEGVVCKTLVPLYDNRGERVMWKLKGRDFARPR